MREWIETRPTADGLKIPVLYSVPDDLPNEVFERCEADPFRCVATKRNGERCNGSPAHGLTLCPVHRDRGSEPLYVVRGGMQTFPCPCGCGYQTLGGAVHYSLVE